VRQAPARTTREEAYESAGQQIVDRYDAAITLVSAALHAAGLRPRLHSTAT
jgi:hypothetical protein